MGELSILIGILVFFFAGVFVGTLDYWALEREAFERGYMVECVGKSGYYWECE